LTDQITDRQYPWPTWPLPSLCTL